MCNYAHKQLVCCWQTGNGSHFPSSELGVSFQLFIHVVHFSFSGASKTLSFWSSNLKCRFVNDFSQHPWLICSRSTPVFNLLWVLSYHFLSYPNVFYIKYFHCIFNLLIYVVFLLWFLLFSQILCFPKFFVIRFFII